MKTYWKLSNAERAALTEEEVTAFVEIELMEKGVLNVPPAVELLEIAEPELQKTMVFVVSTDNEYHGTDRINYGFTTADSAQAFADLLAKRASRIENGYHTGRVEYLKPFTKFSVSSTLVVTHEDYLKHKAELEKIEARKKANEETKAERVKIEKAISEATGDMWSDWHECRGHAARLDNVRATYVKYLELSDGSASVARNFLLKAYENDRKLIEEALGVTLEDSMTTGPKA